MTELQEYIAYLDEMNPIGEDYMDDDDYMDVDDEQEFYEFEYLSEDELCIE